MGTGRFLKEKNRAIRVIGVEPDDSFHGIEGLKHMATSIVPGIYHEEQLDEKIGVSTDETYDMVQRLSNVEGLLVGQSCGAAMIGALQIAATLDEGVIVMIFPDFGDRYLSTNVWLALRDGRPSRA